jgi:GMP synthase-like glutamine amidotransferase
MKKSVLLLKNVAREGPGLVEQVLSECGLEFKIVEFLPPFSLPPVENFGAIFVFGGPESANDQSGKMLRELEIIQESLQKDLPFLGICLGMQVLVKAAGGQVLKSPLKEVGFRDPDGNFFEIVVTKRDALFAGLSERLPVFQLHGETVELGQNIELLAEGKFCKNQIVKVGARAYGIQCHFELTQSMMEEWMVKDPDLCKISASALRADYAQQRDSYERTGRQLIRNFLQTAGYLTE